MINSIRRLNMIRFLSIYIRQTFCKHEFIYEEKEIKEEDWYNADDEIWNKGREGVKVSITCKKCAYHKSYWKF
jgi:hypothetical protein